MSSCVPHPTHSVSNLRWWIWFVPQFSMYMAGFPTQLKCGSDDDAQKLVLNYNNLLFTYIKRVNKWKQAFVTLCFLAVVYA